MKPITKICKVHGELTEEQCRRGIEKRWGIQPNYFYKCKQCIAGYNKKYVKVGSPEKLEHVKKLRKAQIIKHKVKLNESRRRRFAEHKERIKFVEKQRRLRNVDHIRDLSRKTQKRWRDNLDDNYIKAQLRVKYKMKNKDVPSWMIEVKRAIIQLRRCIREKMNE